MIAKLLYMLASCTCVVVVVVVVDGVVIGFVDNTVVDTVFYRECIEGYMLIRTKETLDTRNNNDQQLISGKHRYKHLK